MVDWEKSNDTSLGPNAMGFWNRYLFLTPFPKKKTEKVVKEVKRKFCELRISSKSSCNKGDFFRSIFSFTILLFKNLRPPTMLSIQKTVEMDEEMKTKKINCELLAGNAVKDSARRVELSIIYSFAILLQWRMKLLHHLHLQQ